MKETNKEGEIKTGKYGYLTGREKSVKNIIENKNIKHEIIHIETVRNDGDVNINDSQDMIDGPILKIPHIEEK